MSNVDFICNDCRKKFDIFNIDCPHCNDPELEKENYAIDALKNLQKDFNKYIKIEIETPSIYFADTYDEKIDAAYIGSIKQFEGKSAEEIFLNGFKYGIKDAMDWLNCLILELGIKNE